MPAFFRIQCPKCSTVFDVCKDIYDEGPEALVYCPLCTARWPREDGQVIGATFALRS